MLDSSKVEHLVIKCTLQFHNLKNNYIIDKLDFYDRFVKIKINQRSMVIYILINNFF